VLLNVSFLISGGEPPGRSALQRAGTDRQGKKKSTRHSFILLEAERSLGL